MKSRSSAAIKEHSGRDMRKEGLYCQSGIHEEAQTVEKTHRTGLQLVHVGTVTEPPSKANAIISLIIGASA